MITHEELKTLFSYDTETGEFTRLTSTGNQAKGSIAGCLNLKGYIQIQIKGNKYLAHRLGWFYCFKEWPINQIDHINGDRADNRLDNIREATNAENMRNRSMQYNNKSGFKGVYFIKDVNKFRAYIGVDGKLKHLGLFATAEEASAVYEAAAKLHHGEFYNKG